MPDVYKLGVSDALTRLGLTEDQPSTAARIGVPAAAGLGVAGLIYALMRRPRLATNATLRGIQQASKGKLTGVEYAIPHVLRKTRDWMPDGLHRRILKTVRGTDDFILHPATSKEMERAGRFEDDVLRGGRPDVRPQQQVEGAVLNFNDPYLSRVYQGDVNPAGNVVDNLRIRADKLREAELLQQHMPGIGPTPYSTVKEHLSAGGTAPERLSHLQETLRQRIPGGEYIIKPRNAMGTGDVIQGSSNLAQLYEGTGQKSKWLKKMLEHPENYVVQGRLPLVTERRLPLLSRRYHEGSAQLPVEYRVHTVGGQIIPKATSRRYPTVGSLNPIKTWREKRDLIRTIQPELDRLPPELRERLMMGMDVAKTEKGWKIIETNPVGGQSGFLAPDATGAPTTAPHHIYRAITGRHSKPMSAIKALAGGAGAAAGTAASVDAIEPT